MPDSLHDEGSDEGSDSGVSTSDDEYFPHDSESDDETAEKLDSMMLTPKTKKWLLSGGEIRNEIGLGYDDYAQICNMPENERFSESMWNSTLTQLPNVEFLGEHEGFSHATLGCTEPLQFFSLFWPHSTLTKICMQQV